MSRKLLLGELLVQQNLVSQDTVDTALRVQVGGNRRLGYILVRMKEITADQLAETLAQQLNTPIIAIAEKFSPKAKKKFCLATFADNMTCFPLPLRQTIFFRWLCPTHRTEMPFPISNTIPEN